MSGRFWLDWAIVTISLFNAMLVLWLGLTVLLTGDRRHRGVWLMSGGLFTGAAFFISHSAIVGQPLRMNLAWLNVWWRVGWIPVIVAPFAWYVAVLWYSGFGSGHANTLARRHRGWLWLMALWLTGLLGWMLAANPIPAYDQLVPLDSTAPFTAPPLRSLFAFFPLWMVACILLSIDALARPAPADDSNTGRARQHARPWLLATAGAFLVVGLVVAYVIGSVILATRAGRSAMILVATVATYDLALLLLMTVASLALGQAIISYEIFTGRVLPRRSLLRHWRNAVFLAGGYAAIAGWSIAAHLRPIDSLLLAMVPMALFYALYSWRSLREQEQLVARLRPFLHSPGRPSNTPAASSSANELLAALCRHMLDTRQAQLIPVGSVAPLAGPPLRYPLASAAPPLRPPPDLEQGMTPLDPQQFAPYCWALPVRSERGLIGVLLIGEKQDGGLYSQEEMDIAQATAERILQLLASEQMVRHLMQLQRSRTAEQRVMDLRTRRILHDEILPTLHLAILELGGADRQQPAIQGALDTLADAHRQIAALLTDVQPAPARGPGPCDLIGGLQTLLHTEFTRQFEEVRWYGHAALEGSGAGTVYVDAVTGEVVLGAAREVIRNAALHGRGGRPDTPLRLEIGLCVQETELLLSIRDNGVGMDATTAAVRSGGSGSGLALHSTLLAMVGGYLTVESLAKEGTLARIVVASNGQPHDQPSVEAFQSQNVPAKQAEA